MKLPVTRTQIQTRYSDTDAMGHVSSGSYITFMEVGRLDFFQAVMRQSGRDDLMANNMVVANINIDYLRECRFDDDIEVVSWCSRVGTKSLTLNNDIFANGQLVARGSVTSVGFDPQTRQSAALPEGWEVSDY